MPQVPKLDISVTSPSGPSGGFFNIGGATPEAFGAGVGQAQQGLGRRVEEASDVLAKHAIQMQTRLNQAEADEKSVDYIVAQAELDEGFRTLEGKARVDGFKDYMQKTKQLREKFSGSLSNEESRYLFDSSTRRYLAYSIRNEATATGVEGRKYATQANQRLVNASEIMVRNNPQSDDIFNTANSTSSRAVRQEAANKGWGEDEINEVDEKTASRLWKARIETLAERGNLEEASIMLEKNGKKILPKDRDDLNDRLASGKARAGSLASLQLYGEKQLAQADVASVEATGQGVPGTSFDRISRTLGPIAAREWAQQRESARVVWWHTHDMATTSRQDMEEQLKNLTPIPGSADFEQKTAVYNEVKKKFTAQIELRNTDPAQSVINDPTVKEAYQLTGPDKQAKLVDARMAAQERAGIPREMQSPITVNESIQMLNPLTRALPGQERAVLQKISQDFQKNYGGYWESAMRFAVTATENSAETNRVAASVIRKLVGGVPISGPEEAGAVKSLENNAAAAAETGITPPAAKTVPTEKITKPSMSKRILEKLPPTAIGTPGVP